MIAEETETTAPSGLADQLHAALARMIVELNHTPTDDQARTVAARLIAEWQTLDRASTTGEASALVYSADELADGLLADHITRRNLAETHGGVVGVRSGLDHLDEILNGFERGKLYVLAAKPGCGKTTLALQMAATVAQAGEIALYISLENDKEDLARKCACRLGNVSYTHALKGQLRPDVWAAAVGKLRTALGGRLYLATPGATLPSLAALVEDVIARAGRAPAFICLDYLQAWVKRSSATTDQSDLRERIDRTTPALRALGERYGCAVLAIASQNRGGYAQGGMSAIKESGDIEYGADVTMSLARLDPEAVAKNNARVSILRPLEPGQVALQLEVDKNRSGLVGTPFALILSGDRCLVEEADL